MRKSFIRLALSCSVLLLALLLSACGGTVTPPTTSLDTGEVSTPTEEATSKVAQILSNAQTASEVDENFKPTKLTDTFQKGDTVYVTFEIDLTDVTPKDGYYGNVKVEFYEGDTIKLDFTFNEHDNDLKVENTETDEKNIFAYLARQNSPVTKNGKAKLYWCDTNDCSNPELAHTVTFTVK